jgi:hypothetical protein
MWIGFRANYCSSPVNKPTGKPPSNSPTACANLIPLDPVKYDFALFGLGIEERWGIEGILPEF